MTFEQIVKEAERICMERVGRTYDLTTTQVAIVLPTRNIKTIMNDILNKRCPVAFREGRKPIMTAKEIAMYGITLGRWKLDD